MLCPVVSGSSFPLLLRWPILVNVAHWMIYLCLFTVGDKREWQEEGGGERGPERMYMVKVHDILTRKCPDETHLHVQ